MRPEHARARRRVALLALLLVAGTAAALVIVGESPSKPGAAAGTTASYAAVVERRDLVATDTEAGTLGYASPQTVYDRLGGTITWLPQAGRVIKPGGILFRVDGAPVILMDGTTPAYRDLAPGVSDGQDVLQLNRNLVALGFNADAIALDDEWQASTTAAVDELQSSLGEAATGKLALGHVVFLPGEQIVSSVEATLGGGGSGSSSPSATNAGDLTGSARLEYADLQPTPQPAAAGPEAPKPAPSRHPAASHRRRRTSAKSEQALIAHLRSEIEALRSRRGAAPGPSGPGASGPRTANGPSSVKSPSSSLNEPSGGPGGATPTPILQTTSTRPIVTVQLEASKQREATAGQSVTVVLADGETVNGKITAVSAVAQSSPANAANNNAAGQGSGGSGTGGSGSTVPVTITLSGRRTRAGLDQAAVSVNFVQAVAHNVLSVPVTALLAIGGGRYDVQEAAAPHRLIAVTTGLFAAGDVQISGVGIRPGLQVSDSEG